MAFITSSLFIDIFLGLISILYLIYWFTTRHTDHWDKRDIPNIKQDLLLRTLLGRKTQSESVLEMYKKFPNERFVGGFQMRSPILMIRDPDLINKILVKDFMFFQDRAEMRHINNDDPMSGSLFNLNGQVWRTLRHRLIPTFTTGKLRGMFDQVLKSGDGMVLNIEEIANTNKDVDSKNLLLEFTLNVIASCAFGVQFKPSEFQRFKYIVQNILTASIGTLIRFSILFTSPKIGKFLKITAFPKDFNEYFLNLTRTTLKYRKENNIQRNDYFQLLMKLKDQEDSGKNVVWTPTDTTEDDAVILNQLHYAEGEGLSSAVNIKVMTENTICANSVVFLLAGTDTVANTISFTLLNLAQHPDIQRRLQQEVDLVLKHRGDWSYDALKEMTFLDQVVQETQRMYPLVPMLGRQCVVPYKVPGSDFVIEKGTLISIPVAGLHQDPQYYPEPERFNPDRFEGNNFKPNPTFLPFGDGPRICIAMRFAILEVKTCVARIMANYMVKLSPKTQTPIKLSRSSLSVTVEGGVWLNFIHRKVSQ